jgi:hypothetical protein
MLRIKRSVKYIIKLNSNVKDNNAVREKKKIKGQRRNLIREEQKRKESITTKAKVHELCACFRKTNPYECQFPDVQIASVVRVTTSVILQCF